jgi:glycosyltransferase involved in cell wall biosynthesis
MRILLTADPEIEVPPRLYGGAERLVDGLLRQLKSDGHEVGLAARKGSQSPADAFFSWPGGSSQVAMDTIANSWTLWNAVRAFRPDVIHSFSRLAYLPPLLRGRIPIVMSYGRDPTPRTVRMAVRLAARNVLAFDGCSDYIAGLGRRGGGEWHAIPNFVDTEFLTYSPRVEPDAPLLFLSRVEEIKGAHWAIEIAKRCKQRLIIAGNHGETGGEGEYWRNVIVPQLGRDGIEYVGPVNDEQKNKLYGESKALLVPIQWDEPFGLVFAEAMACGTPVISCPRGGLPQIVRQGIDGFLIKSVEEGCEAVGKIGRIDRAGCRKQIVDNFTQRVIVARFVQLYRQMIARLAAT